MVLEVVELSITPIERSPWGYRLNVSGSGFVPNQTVYWRLGGEDQRSEDFISAPSGGWVIGPDGMFFFTDTATGANLNEDCRGQDETFADAYYTWSILPQVQHDQTQLLNSANGRYDRMNHVAVLEFSMLGEELKTDKQRVIRTLRNLTTYKSFR